MRFIFVFIALVLLSLGSSAQALKMNEFSAQFRKHNINERISFESTANDSILIERLSFRDDGLVTEQTGFFAGKRKLFVQRFEYNDKGMLVGSVVSHVFNDWQEVSLVHEYNENGQLMSRLCPQEIRNFWAKEVYLYDEKGSMSACERYAKEGEEWIFIEKESYSNQIYSGENTPSYIHDERGLLVIQQIKSAATRGSGAMKRFSYR